MSQTSANSEMSDHTDADSELTNAESEHANERNVAHMSDVNTPPPQKPKAPTQSPTSSAPALGPPICLGEHHGKPKRLFPQQELRQETHAEKKAHEVTANVEKKVEDLLHALQENQSTQNAIFEAHYIELYDQEQKHNTLQLRYKVEVCIRDTKLRQYEEKIARQGELLRQYESNAPGTGAGFRTRDVSFFKPDPEFDEKYGSGFKALQAKLGTLKSSHTAIDQGDLDGISAEYTARSEHYYGFGAQFEDEIDIVGVRSGKTEYYFDNFSIWCM